jgi:peptidoglycan/LPS O-acetylase OafA/YrhL
MKHLTAIDGLRAIAVLAVVAYHAGLPVPAGFVGVDVFFVISGYVITRMLSRERQDTGRIDFAAFYARRVRRILPALVVVVASVLAASAVMLSPDLRIATSQSAMAAMAMSANVWFQLHTGYFDVGADQQPLLHLWSLGVEEQFYLIWPLLLIACGRKPWVLAGLAVASFVLWRYLSPTAAFYEMPARFWELALGGLIALAPKIRSGAVAGWAGLAIVALAIGSDPTSEPTLRAVVGAALVIYGIHCGASLAPLELAPVRYVGLVSYSLYLWHWPLLVLRRVSSFDAPTLTDNLLLCALAFVLAALSYHLIEMPIRKAQAPKYRAVGLGVLACLTLAGCAAAAEASVPPNPLAGSRPEIARECYQTHADTPGLPPTSCGTGPVVLWGDSHAQAWLPYARKFGKVRLLSRTGCPPSDLPPVPRHKSDAEIRRERIEGTLHATETCAQFNALALAEAKRGEVVILASRWIGRYDAETQEDAERGVASLLDTLNGRVIVMGPLPVMPHDPADCIAKRKDCAMSRAEFERQAEPVRVYLRALVAAHPNATFVDPTDFFCTADTCPMQRGGIPLFWDDNHISRQAATAFR